MEAFIAAIVFGAIGAAVILTALYLVIKAAVRNGIREAAEKRPEAREQPQAPADSGSKPSRLRWSD